MNSETVQGELEEESKLKSFMDKSNTAEIGLGMWKDNPLYDEFVAAMKEARDEINANPNRL